MVIGALPPDVEIWLRITLPNGDLFSAPLEDAELEMENHKIVLVPPAPFN